MSRTGSATLHRRSRACHRSAHHLARQVIAASPTNRTCDHDRLVAVDEADDQARRTGQLIDDARLAVDEFDVVTAIFRLSHSAAPRKKRFPRAGELAPGG